jgi:hypothetical protein
MNYLESPLNFQRAGAIVTVSLTGVESDVMLLDSNNLQAFKRGAWYQYHGGHYKNSPVQLQVPSAGTWAVVIVPGPGGQVSAQVQVTQAA